MKWFFHQYVLQSIYFSFFLYIFFIFNLILFLKSRDKEQVENECTEIYKTYF